MNDQTVTIYGQMLAAYARIEGMKAENAHRIDCGNSIAYGEDAFNIEATHLEDLARRV